MPHRPADGTRNTPRREPGTPNVETPADLLGPHREPRLPAHGEPEPPVRRVGDHGTGRPSWDDIGLAGGASSMPTPAGADDSRDVVRSVQDQDQDSYIENAHGSPSNVS